MPPTHPNHVDPIHPVDTESFSFLNELAEAFRSGESNPRPSHFPVLEGIRAVLAHLQSAGRLVTAGGMALTAEQVEDVEALVATANPYSAPAARLRALFPATEPAEERRSFPTIQDVPNNTLFHTHGGNGSSLFVRNRFGELRLSLGASQYWSKPLAESEFLPSSGPFMEVPWPELPQPPADPFAQPAPAKPAEEETQAEGFCSFCGWSSDACARGEGDCAPAEPAEAPCTICNVNETNHAGVSYYHPFTTELGPFDDEGNERPTPAVTAEEETKAEGPRKFRKKPVEIEAMQYDGKDWRSIAQWMAAHGAPMGRTTSGLLRIHTLEGEMTAGSGDWIIKGTQGEFYPCKPAPFADTFEAASSPVVPAPTETGTNSDGLTDKYIVRRVDGSDAEGGRNFGRRYFVLSYDSDPHARVALAAYAASCETDYPELAADLRARLGVKEAAPIETGPWQRIEDVPKNVMVRGTDGTWRGDPDGWLRSPGARASANQYAPFVAAEEG